MIDYWMIDYWGSLNVKVALQLGFCHRCKGLIHGLPQKIKNKSAVICAIIRPICGWYLPWQYCFQWRFLKGTHYGLLAFNPLPLTQ
jgi:hypothetical protein